MCLLTILLVVSFYYISYLSIDFTNKKHNIEKENQTNHIVVLSGHNDNSPILFIKKD